MNLAFCYENVLPQRGGCETYIADLARRLVADGHEVHLYACRWDASRLPSTMHFHGLTIPRGPRFLRPWRFGKACLEALKGQQHDVSIGFDKTWGQDVLYPQGGLHRASADYNLRKQANKVLRGLAHVIKRLDLAHWSYSRLEKKQYLGETRPLVVVNSELVRHHFQHYLGHSSTELRVVRSAIDPVRFHESDRFKRRIEARQNWEIAPDETVALIAAMNYRLKGLGPLLHAVHKIPQEHRFRLLVVGNQKVSSFRRLAERLKITDRVCFAGHCADMRNAYFAADFLVHPTFYDPCSLVVLEALACGLPVITTQANGAHELLHPPQEGYVVADPHDHDQLAWCITQLLDPSRRAACARAARQASLQWTFEHHYQKLLEVISEAASRKRAA
jgi:UDP-glucose:(heptosyl)LPS alpha-1,3-glucosyltransferase